MRKGTEEADVEVVAVRLDREGRGAKLMAPGAIGWRVVGHDCHEEGLWEREAGTSSDAAMRDCRKVMLV